MDKIRRKVSHFAAQSNTDFYYTLSVAQDSIDLLMFKLLDKAPVYFDFEQNYRMIEKIFFGGLILCILERCRQDFEVIPANQKPRVSFLAKIQFLYSFHQNFTIITLQKRKYFYHFGNLQKNSLKDWTKAQNGLFKQLLKDETTKLSYGAKQGGIIIVRIQRLYPSVTLFMKKMDYQKNQQFFLDSEGQSNKSELETTQLGQILQETRRNTLSFIQELKEKALTPISQQVLSHYIGQIKASYLVKDIVSMIDKRISKMIRNKKIKKNWNQDDIVLLLWFVSKYIEINKTTGCESFTNQDWDYLSRLIPGSNSKGCMFKFISLKKVKLSLFNWSSSEETMLLSLVEQLGLNRWKQISQRLYESNQMQKIFRTPKQCRQHWNCYLDPRLKKGPWSQLQDLKLLENIRKNKGQRKWSSIKFLFEGRTENALKNRYNLLIQRQKRLTPSKNQSELVKEYIKGKTTSHIAVEQVDFVQKNQQSQIFEQIVQESKNKGLLTKEDEKIVKTNELVIKSQKSSFRLPGAFESSRFYQVEHKQQVLAVQRPLKGFMLMVFLYITQNMGTVTSIYTNQQGFFTNYMLKPFYKQ